MPPHTLYGVIGLAVFCALWIVISVVVAVIILAR
jgi:hypothetical protein